MGSVCHTIISFTWHFRISSEFVPSFFSNIMVFMSANANLSTDCLVLFFFTDMIKEHTCFYHPM